MDEEREKGGKKSKVARCCSKEGMAVGSVV